MRNSILTKTTSKVNMTCVTFSCTTKVSNLLVAIRIGQEMHLFVNA